MRAVWVLLLLAAPLWPQQNGQTPQYQPNWPCTGKERAFDPAYLRTAEATGGQMFLLDRSEAGAFSVLEINDMKHKATVARSVGTLENYRDIRFPVDPSIESLYISASLQCTQRVVIYDPLNAEVRPEINGGEDHVYHAGRISVIPHPAPGVWTVRLLGSGTYSLVAQAKTPVVLRVNFDAPDRISLRTTAPAPGLRFRLVNEAGDPLQNLLLEAAPDNSGRYEGSFMRPSQRFRVLVEALDEQGNAFLQRADARLFEP